MSRWYSRLAALDRQFTPPPTDPGVVVIKPNVCGREGPPIVRRDRLVTLTVPREFNGNVQAGLTPEQQATIPPGARIITVHYIHRWRDHDDGPDSFRRDLWASLRGKDTGPGEDPP